MSIRMTATDAQFYWMSAKIPSDDFMLYAFDGLPSDFAYALDEVRTRACACQALTVRVEDGSPLTYPRWVPAAVADDQVTRHQLDDDSWQGCLDAVGLLANEQVDIRRATWHLHVFAPVRGVAGASGPSTVVAVQMPHAVADGNRSATIGGWLFGRPAAVPDIVAPSSGFLLSRGVVAAQAHRSLERDIAAGRLRPSPGTRPPVHTNSKPAGKRYLRTLVRDRPQLRGPTVTVAAMAAVSGALSAHLGEESLIAEVPVAKAGARQANNHFTSVTVKLYPELDSQSRLQRIATDLADARLRAQHPAVQAADRAFEAVPAPLLRWGVGHFDPDARPAQVSGHTVVSSVYRGPADLRFGDAPVLLTATFPPLSPAMALTHGVFGIGNTVVISVLAAESAVHGIDDYLARLDAEL